MIGRLGAALAIFSAPILGAPLANATAEGFCTQLGAAWDGTTCTHVVESRRQAHMILSLRLPQEHLDDPVAGPVLRDYYHRLVDGWRATGLETPRDSTAHADYELYAGPAGIQSVIIHETFAPFGMQANNAYRSFVFDKSAGRQLALNDLFRPNVDVAQVISEAAAPTLQTALDAAPPPHAPGTYPFTAQEWCPGPDGPGYSGDYQTFGLAADWLVLYMPGQPMVRENPSPRDRLVWSMDGGTVVVRVPLNALRGALQPQYGGVQ